MSSSTSSTSESAASGAGSSRRFACAGLRGEVSAAHQVPFAELRRVIDPAAAETTVHWGRNYLYRATLALPEGSLPVVVKTFPGNGALKRLQRRFKGSKAQRSFSASLALRQAGVPVPTPVAALESSDGRGPSFFVCEHLETALEARHLFRALHTGRERELFPGIDAALVLERLGATLRRMHEAALWHRDVSAGNVLLTGDWSRPGAGGELYLVDVARTRVGRALTRSERMRDLARLPLARAGDRETLLRSYRGGAPPRLDRLLLAVHHHAFHRRHRLKDLLRAGRRALPSLRSRGAHPHIPPAPEGAATRERVVWDPLSDQPHLYAGRSEKLRARLADAGVHAQEAAVLARRLPAALARWRTLRRELPPRPVACGEVGVGLHGGSAPASDLVAEIEALGVRRVLLRLHPWEGELERDRALAAELRARGTDVVLAVAQNRDLIRDRARWRAALVEIGDRFAGLVEHVQVGHAINRSKWGIWTHREYAALVADAGELLADAHGMKIVGPAVIDFEPHATCIALNWPGNPVRFAAVTSLLYVDRRGAPESRQLGLDAVDKAALVRAVIQTSRDGERPSWVTEVNWPLREGPHSPAGRHVAVGEEEQADYLARYHLLLLGSGLVERIYWWQLVARGYGLVDPVPGGLRRRPAWRALAFVARLLDRARARGPLAVAPPLRAHEVERADGSRWVVAWSVGDRIGSWKPPRPPRRLFTRDGEEIAVPAGEIAVGPSPLYADLGRDQDSG